MNYTNNIILVIDNNINNIKIIVDYLKESGFETAVAKDGEIGLKRAEQLNPLLILMDVMMPEMNGFETCRKLKANDVTKDIPVIFMTALDSADDKIKAFECGGVDYIAKPAPQEEVLARVKTHISLREAQKELLEQNARLHQEITKRRQTEDRIKSALAEKEVLLKEVHHRVKNNLQVLIHLIDMQAETVISSEVIKAFEDLQGRIRAMAVVHENLYQSDDLSQIDFGVYIKVWQQPSFRQ
ncbi:MAG: response regulator [Desulfobacteraceae bacterium]|nr:response regulator [Desulfobacteraceae bacterium]